MDVPAEIDMHRTGNVFIYILRHFVLAITIICDYLSSFWQRMNSHECPEGWSLKSLVDGRFAIIKIIRFFFAARIVQHMKQVIISKIIILCS